MAQELLSQQQSIQIRDDQVRFVERITQSFEIVADTLDPNSRRIYVGDLRTFVQWLFERDSTLDRAAMAAYHRFLDEHYKKTTAKRMWSVVFRTLQAMIDDHYLDEHPARGIRGFKAQGNYTKHIALSKDDAKKLLSVVPADTMKGKRDLAMLQVLLYTGLRRSECASLTLGQMRQVQGHQVLLLEEEDTKNNEAAMVKLPVKVWRTIQDYLQATGRIQLSETAPLFAAFRKGDTLVETSISDMVIYRTVIEYAKVANIKGLLPHGMRASFITLSLEGGAPLYKVAHNARYKGSRMTEHYLKRKQDLDKSAVDYMEM